MQQRSNKVNIENVDNHAKAISRVLRYLSDHELRKIASISRSWNQLINVILQLRMQIKTAASEHECAVISDAFIQSFACSTAVKFTMTPIIGGCSPWSSTYKIEFNDNKLVLRHTSQQRKLESRYKEARMASQFSKLSLSPHVHYTNAHDGIIIQDYIQNIPRWHYQLDDVKVAALASKIRVMTNMACPQEIDDAYDATGMVIERKLKLKSVFERHPVFILQEQALVELEQMAVYLQRSGLAHNNLHLNNILFDGNEFWIIDLESVNNGDISLDLAMLSASARMKPETEKKLLNAFFDREPDQLQQAHYIIMKAMSYLLLSASFFANCDNYNELSMIAIDRLPNFMAYDPKIDGAVDMNSSMGKYIISVMLAKEALRLMTSMEYRDAIQFMSDKKSPVNRNFFGNRAPESARVPAAFAHQVFARLTDSELQNAGKVCRQWRILGRAAFFSRRQPARLPLQQCSEAVRTRIEQSLVTRLYLNPGSPIEIQPIQGGLSPWANIYIAEFNQEKYVIRVLNANLSRQEKAREIATTQLFSERGVSPQVEYTDLANGIILMRYIQHQPKWMMPMSQSKLIELARLLRVMHSIKLSSDTTQFAANHRMQQFEEKVHALTASPCLGDILNKVLAAHTEILSLLSHQLDHTLCHYDLNPWNLLHDGQRLWAIDWEFSQVGHPLLDLATIANFLRLPPEKDHFLLTCYFGGKITDENKHIYYLMKQLSYLRYAICSLGLCENMNMQPRLDQIEQLPPFQQFIPGKNPPFAIDKATDEGRMMIAIMFAKEALQNRQSSSYQDAIEAIKMTHLSLKK